MLKSTKKPETARDFCIDIAVFTFQLVDELVVEFFAALGKSEGELPDSLRISTAKWIAAQDAIEAAAGKEDIEGVITLCQQFEKRAKATIEDRKRKMGLVIPSLPARAAGEGVVCRTI